ncbi:class F sortase [Micromonospora sonneratiae]
MSRPDAEVSRPATVEVGHRPPGTSPAVPPQTRTVRAERHGPHRGLGRGREGRGLARRPGRRRHRRSGRWRMLLSPIPVIIVLMVLIISGLVAERITGVTVLPSGLTEGLRPPPRKFPVLAASEPVSVASQAIRLDAPVHSLGLAPDGTIAAPSAEQADEAGWYRDGPTPGQYGPSVIVGHVDTRTGPAVFHNLNRLRAGDRVEVTRQDNSVAIFEVNTTKTYDKAQIPADEVYGDFSRPGLRLITCGGRWVGGSLGYADNLIVFASLVGSRQA